MLQAAVQNRFLVLYMATGGREMLMVEQVHRPTESTVWMHLPDERFESAFPEFQRDDEKGLPKKAGLLVGDHNRFLQQFKFGQDEN